MINKNIVVEENNKNKRFNTANVLCYFVVILIAFIASLQSNSNIFVYREQATDSSVFQYIAKMMLNGYLPYRDTFDHKGPLLYIFDCVGMMINQKWGIWVMELISLVFTYVFMYKTFLLKCNKFLSLIILLFSYASFGDYIYGGNFCEEYALPFISVSLFCFLDYLINENISNFKVVVCGLCFGAVLLLRPNMAGMWPVMCIAVLIYCIYKKRFLDPFKFLAFFLCGMLVVMIPTIIWMLSTGILYDCWDCYILFNSTYINGKNIYDRFIVYGTFQMDAPVIISIGICFFEAIYRNSIKPIGYMVLIFLSLVFVSMSGVPYAHYGLVLIPIILFPYSLLFSVHDFKKKSSKYTFIIVSIILSAYILTNSRSIQIFERAAYDMTHSGEVYYPEKYQQVVDLIDEYTADTDNVLFFGKLNRYYLITDRLSISKYSYQTPIFDYAMELGWPEAFFEELSMDKPKIIGVMSEKYNISQRYEMYYFLETNGYIEILETEDMSLYLLSE